MVWSLRLEPVADNGRSSTSLSRRAADDVRDEAMTAMVGDIRMMEPELLSMPTRRGLDLLATAAEGDRYGCKRRGVKRKLRVWGVKSWGLNR